MERMVGMVAALCLAMVLSLAGPMDASASAAHAHAIPVTAARHVPGRLLIKYKTGLDARTDVETLRARGGRVVRTVPQLKLHVVEVREDQLEETLQAYAADPAVAYVSLDYTTELASEPNDPYFADGKQWGPRQIMAPGAWDISSGAGVTIALLDSGVDAGHPDLQGRLVPGYNFYDYPPNADTADRCGHGTHLAGVAVATANNGQGIAGIAYNSRIMPVKVIGDTCGGSYTRLIDGILYAADHGARIISISSGGTVDSASLRDAVAYARSKGALVIAAAGNSNSSAPFFPAAYGSAVAVAGTTSADARYTASNYGAWIDVAAPALSIYSTAWTSSAGSTYSFMSGTSDAAPAVAAVAALVLAQHPAYSADQLEQAIENGADDLGSPGWDQYFGWGRINAYRALGGTIPPTATATATATAAPTATDTPSATPTASATATSTNTPTPLATATATSTSTAVPWTSTPTATSTDIPPAPTSTATPSPTATPIPALPTSTATPTAIPPTSTATATPTAVWLPTATATEVPATGTPVPLMATLTPTPTPLPTAVPATPAPTATYAAIMPTQIATASVTPSIPAATLSPISTESPLPTAASAPTARPSGTPLPPTPTLIPETTPMLPTATPTRAATPSEQPAATATLGETTHDGNLDGKGVASGAYWKASVTITAHDTDHMPLAGVRVSGNWGGGYSGAASCVTDDKGQCNLMTGNIKKNKASATFTVTVLTFTGHKYFEKDNHDPEGDTDGTTITVTKP